MLCTTVAQSAAHSRRQFLVTGEPGPVGPGLGFHMYLMYS